MDPNGGAGGGAAAAAAAAAAPSVVPRACYNCRVRKIKCNRESPCSNCLTSNIQCQPSARPGRAAAVMASPVIGGNAAIRSLEDRLAKIENAVVSLSMQNIKSSESPPGAIDRTLPQHQSPRPHVSVSNKSWTDSPMASFEADSTFEQQTLQATSIGELNLDDSGDKAVAEHIKALKQSIYSAETAVAAQRKHMRPEVMLEMDVIPSSFTLQVLRRASQYPTLLISFHPIPDFSEFEKLAQRVYFPVEPLTIGELTSFHGMLSFLMWELSLRPEQEPLEDMQIYQQACESNFQLGIQSNEIAAIPTFYNAMALCMGALAAQRSANTARQNLLISVSARHCLSLGYHRKPKRGVSEVDAERQSRLFWHVYMSEASLTLRLGRAAIIQDYDVDVPPAKPLRTEGYLAWTVSFELFLDFARLQAQLYSTLYSPASKMIDPSRRKQCVTDLAVQMNQWRRNWLQLDFSKAICSHIFHAIFPATDVMYYSVLTLLYRGTTISNAPSDIPIHCFQAARNGLEAHLVSFPRAVQMGREALSNYGCWLLSYSSFTPFVVTFVYCITTSDEPSLELLRNVLVTLEEIVAANEEVRNQYNVCRALYQTAESYLKSRNSAPPPPPTTYAEQRTVHLPLQMAIDDNWSNMAASLEQWNPSDYGQQVLSLDNHID